MSGAGIIDQLSGFSGALRSRGLTVTSEQTAYNQPPHPSFHIGGGMAAPPKPDIHVK